MAKNVDELAAELKELIDKHTVGNSLQTVIEALELLVDDYKFFGGEAEDET
jgi:hypothetical protein